MVEMKVFGLALDEDSQVPVLILKDAEEKRVLPIWIGAMEAMAISLALNEVELPRPMTHDLLLAMITNMDGKLTNVDVVSIREGTYYAELEVEQNGKRKRIDCRPSDGIALALRAERAHIGEPGGAGPGRDGEEAGNRRGGRPPMTPTSGRHCWKRCPPAPSIKCRQPLPQI